MTMLTKELDDLIILKKTIKTLEEEAKALQTLILSEPDHPKNYKGLILTTRDNYSKLDNCDVIKVIGLPAFKENATISMTGIKKAGGDAAVNKLLATGKLTKGEPSVYYTYKEPK
jgi:hypothetical protein